MTDKAKLTIIGVTLLVLAAIVAAVLIPRGGGDDNSKKTDTTASSTTGATGADSSKDSLPKPTDVVSEGEKASVTMDTSEGSFTIELDTTNDPITANNFAYLTDKGFYDGLTFHRIVPDFVIQGGDPTGTGSGGPGYKVVEAPPKNTKYTPGVVAMAKTGTEAPGTSGSQFFVVTGSQGSSLTPDYAVVGKVTSGMDVVKKIGKIPADASTGKPDKTVTIDKATLEKS